MEMTIGACVYVIVFWAIFLATPAVCVALYINERKKLDYLLDKFERPIDVLDVLLDSIDANDKRITKIEQLIAKAEEERKGGEG